jgi:uncharacterized protein YndB with AHSA1/START domain
VHRLRFPTDDDSGGGLFERRHRATSQSERTLAAPVEEIWKVVEDPHHMPRWWPKVKRMEGVEDDRFTQVFMTRRGRPIRADFHVVESQPPSRRVWQQDVEGTPFQRVLSESIVEIVLQPVDAGTHVLLAQRQKMRGYSRTGGFLVKRATGRILDEALEGLARVCE